MLCFLALVVAMFVRVRWFGVDVYLPAVRKNGEKKCRRRCGPATPRSSNSSSTTREKSNQDGYVKKAQEKCRQPIWASDTEKCHYSGKNSKVNRIVKKA